MKTDNNFFDQDPQVFSCIPVTVNQTDLARQIKTSADRPGMFEAAQETLKKVDNLWNPSAVYSWCGIKTGKSGSIGTVQGSGNCVNMDFGHSIEFLTPASHALISVFTAGSALEKESSKASEKGDLLEAYFMDMIGLIVLEKTGDFIKQAAEKKALEKGWGVSPFLSPGSVHGWELSEQKKLCSLLPIEKINVTAREDAVLSPFKSLSCLIGLGQGYDAVKVGTTCKVCSKRHDCPMKEI